MAAVEVVGYEDVRLTDTASVLARAFATDPVFSWVLLPHSADVDATVSTNRLSGDFFPLVQTSSLRATWGQPAG
jgi:hypothetical protein